MLACSILTAQGMSAMHVNSLGGLKTLLVSAEKPLLQFAPWRPDYVQRVYGYKPYEIPFNQISG